MRAVCTFCFSSCVGDQICCRVVQAKAAVTGKASGAHPTQTGRLSVQKLSMYTLRHSVQFASASPLIGFCRVWRGSSRLERVGCVMTGTDTTGTGHGSGTTIGSGMTGTGVGAATTGTGIGGAHPVVTNSNLSSTPILGGEGVTSAAGHTGAGHGTGHPGTGHTGSGHTETGTKTEMGGSGTAPGAKGSQYDATGGQVDDRSMMQKGMDAIKPGSQVGQHGKK